jgi:hypothetical protein
MKKQTTSLRHGAFKLSLLGFGLAWSLSAAAQANLPGRELHTTRVYTDVGTQGLGLGVAFGISESFDARIGMTSLKLNRSIKGDTLDTDAQLKFNNIGLYGDYYPFGGGFRLTGGVQTGQNKVDLTSKPNGSVTVNGHTYTGAPGDSITGQLNLSNTAPYVGLGYSSRGDQTNAGLSLNFDLGVRMGSADVSLQANGFNNLPAAQRAQLDADLAKERAKLQDDVKVLKTYPVLSLGLSYRW